MSTPAAPPEALTSHARHVAADEREAFGRAIQAVLPAGHVLVQTCHRVEVYGAPLAGSLRGAAPAGTVERAGDHVVEHLVRLAVGRESVVLAEDQVLHQLRRAVSAARAHGPLPLSLDRLFDVALRSGRHARSWLPSRRGSLADLALDRVMQPRDARGELLIVGAGQMGRLAARAAAARSARLLITSRTPERAHDIAAELGAGVTNFDPGASAVGHLDGVVVALGGRWPIGDETARALAASTAWVIDLSAPTALTAALGEALGDRLLTIDDLAADDGPGLAPRLVARLDELVGETVSSYLGWARGAGWRAAARRLDERADAVRSAELAALWERLPMLQPDERREVERMARHLTERLLRDPLERLHADVDGRHARAARDLFRL